MATIYDNLDAGLAKAIPLSYFPSAQQFYEEGFGMEPETSEWKGGELLYYTSTQKLFIQTATSGQTATWRVIDSAFATTTSTSTSSSTSTTTSSSSSTSSTTSTSTSTSSSTSTSTSTSSTTTP